MPEQPADSTESEFICAGGPGAHDQKPGFPGLVFRIPDPDFVGVMPAPLFEVWESDLVPPGTAYVFDERALNRAWQDMLGITPTYEPGEDPDPDWRDRIGRIDGLDSPSS